MVDIVGVEAPSLRLLHSQVFGELVDHGADDFHMRKLLGADVRKEAADRLHRHGVPLGQIAHGRRELTVGTAVLTDDELGRLGAGFRNFYRILKPFFIDPHQTHAPSQGAGPFSQQKHWRSGSSS